MGAQHDPANMRAMTAQGVVPARCALVGSLMYDVVVLNRYPSHQARSACVLRAVRHCGVRVLATRQRRQGRAV